MKTNEILVARPSNTDEVKTLKTLLKALKIKFEVAKESPYNPEFVAKIQKTRREYQQGKGRVVKLTVAEKRAIDQGLLSIKEGRVKSHDAVMMATRKKFPALFK